MNSINQILAGLCSSLLLSMNCNTAASRLPISVGLLPADSSCAETRSATLCVPCSFAEQ